MRTKLNKILIGDNLKEIKVVVSDLGNVLIPFDYNIIIQRLNEIEENLGNFFYSNYKQNYEIHREFEKGNLTENEFWVYIKKWTKNLLSFEEFAEIYSNIFTLNEELISYLPEIKSNFKLVLLSNTNSIHQRFGWAKYDFLQYFDKLILSHEVGFAKPEVGIYQSVINFTQEPPEYHLFIDDILEYCQAAENIGWKTIQVKNQSQIISDLKLSEIIKI